MRTFGIQEWHNTITVRGFHCKLDVRTYTIKMVEESVNLFFFKYADNIIQIIFSTKRYVWGIEGLGLILRSIPCKSLQRLEMQWNTLQLLGVVSRIFTGRRRQLCLWVGSKYVPEMFHSCLVYIFCKFPVYDFKGYWC